MSVINKKTTIEKITDGIIAALNKGFNNKHGGKHNKKYAVYTEQAEQGLICPCFFIKLVNHAVTPLMGERYLYENIFCITFIPEIKKGQKDEAQPQRECYKMLERLHLALKYIKVGGNLIRGLKMRGEVIDNTLHFFVCYNAAIRLKKYTHKMKTLEKIDVKTINIKVKGGE